VRIGDWQNIRQFPLTTLGTVIVSRLMLKNPIALEQSMYVPGNDHQGVWGSRWLEHVTYTHPIVAEQATASPMPRGLGVRGDASIIRFLFAKLGSLARTTRALASLI
jgi:hypothetical protein